MTRGRVIGISVCALIYVAIMALINYICLPAWTFRSAGFWWYLVVGVVLAATMITIFYYVDGDCSGLLLGISWGAVGVIVVIFIIAGLIGCRLFHAKDWQQIAKVTVKDDWAADFPDLSNPGSRQALPLVDMDTAITLGDKKMASLSHASWYDVDNEYNLIKYQGLYYRLSTVDYAGFFEYNKAKYEGIPGYVLVPVTPEENGVVTQEATLVTLEQPIRYTPGAFWSYDLKRHLRSQYGSYIFDTSFLEIDEEGVPYWVTGVLTPTTGSFGGKVVRSFVLTNAQTGDSKEYAVTEAPEWIDHIYSLGYLMDIAYYHYAYADGFWNDVFGKTNVLRTSYVYRDTSSQKEGAAKYAHFYGYTSVATIDGEVCFYTGLTAANNAESNLGWLIIDPSTGEMTQYNLVGAEESSAQAAVEQLVQEKGYEAIFPLPVKIAGEASYLMCLKGKAGLVQSYGICNMNNYSIAVQADTLDEAVRLYREKLGGEVVEEENASDAPLDVQIGSGIISAVYTAEIDGTTYFYYVISGELYRSAITLNERQVLYDVGTYIIYNYYDGSDDIKVITSIDTR